MTTPLVVVSPYGERAPSTRVRVYEWLRHLGIEAERHEYAGLGANSPAILAWQPAATLDAEWHTRRLAGTVAGRPVLLSREASPFGWGASEEHLLERASLGVYDLDDALFADRAGWRIVLGKERKCRRAIAAADRVIVGNDFLADYASKHAQELVVIPTCVEPRDYQPRLDHEIIERPRIIWMGSPSTETYLVGIAPALRAVVSTTGAEVLVVSGPRDVEHPQLDGMVTRVPWHADTFADHLRTAHVAIAPLTDDVYARGKCAYKVLQYGAAALPIVASPVGANAVALDRFGAFSATSCDEWVDQLTTVIGLSAADRAAAGARARRAVEEHYSYGAWATSWKKAVAL